MAQAKKRRACPVIGDEISSAECGEHRVSKYACPQTCEFNPFSLPNYPALLDAEGRLDDLCGRRVIDQGDDAAHARLRRKAESSSVHGLHAAICWELFFATDVRDRTLTGSWAEQGFPGLRNDERVLLRGKMRMRVALLEVQRIVDDRQIDVVDLLDPVRPTLRMVDISLAARACRFATILGWVYPLPYFWRTSGSAIVVQRLGPHRPEAVVRACAAHLGAPGEFGALRRWLAEHFVRLDESIIATAYARQRLMLAGLDVETGHASYDLLVSRTACRRALLSAGSVESDALSDKERAAGFLDALELLDPAQPGPMAAGPRVVGRLLLAKKSLRIEAAGSANFAALRGFVERCLADKVRFVQERRDDVGAQMAAAVPQGDASLVPPLLLTEPDLISLSSSRTEGPARGESMADYQARLMAEYRRTWADQPVPQLGGRTPRAAAADPEWRPRVIEMVKEQVLAVDEANLRSGRRDDANALVRELGLHEIDFPPPPPRAPLPEDNDDIGGDDDFAIEEVPWPDLRPLPSQPLAIEAAYHRLERVMEVFPTAQSAFDLLDRTSPGTLDAIEQLATEVLSEGEYVFFAPLFLQLWFSLVPEGAHVSLRPDSLRVALRSERERVARDEKTGVDKLVERSPQPGFLMALFGQAFRLAESTPRKARPSDRALVDMVTLFKVLIDEIALAVRR